MRRSISNEIEGGRSLKTFFFFCLVVFLLIIGSFGLRLFYLFRDSSFDGQHRYTLEIRHDVKNFDILSVEPISNDIKIFNISSKKDIKSIKEDYGVPVDGVIIDNSDRVDNKNLLGKLYGYMLRINSGTGVNSLDVARIILFSYGVDRKNFQADKVTSDFGVNFATPDVFYDKTILDEDKTVAIVNAADFPGLAGKLERVLGKLGVNVVSVTTAPSSEKKSRIEYSGDKSYTLKRVEEFAHFPLKSVDETGISDILIVLGEDSIDSTLK